MLPDRFWSKVVQSGDCWEWTAGCNSGGYGKFKINGKHHLSHRLAYTEVVTEIPEGLDLDHLCRNRACVNPWHLEPVPGHINILRGEGAGAKNARKLTCVNGHDLAGENLASRGGRRGRRCRTCQRAADARWRARLKNAS